VHDGAGTADTTARISEALQRYAVFDDDSAVNVLAENGTITLSGRVSTWEEHDAAIQAAWMGQGVKEVRDQMAVTGGWY
jgi:osmotically-inducible protein OsmY